MGTWLGAWFLRIAEAVKKLTAAQIITVFFVLFVLVGLAERRAVIAEVRAITAELREVRKDLNAGQQQMHMDHWEIRKAIDAVTTRTIDLKTWMEFVYKLIIDQLLPMRKKLDQLPTSKDSVSIHEDKRRGNGAPGNGVGDEATERAAYAGRFSDSWWFRSWR